MKKGVLLVIVVALWSLTGVNAAVGGDTKERPKCSCCDGKDAKSGAAVADNDIESCPSCKYCGMDREKFAHSRMLIQYDDGTITGACSIRCAAIDLYVNVDKTPKALLVGDYATKKLVDAEKAHWVIGGGKAGVMTKRAKWAFAGKKDAERFVTENGGRPATFDEAMQATNEDMYSDTKMIREKRRMKKQ